MLLGHPKRVKKGKIQKNITAEISY
jgi:hypothetical protein